MGLTSTCMCSTAQYVNKIETIFDDKRGRKRVKNQGVSVRGNAHTHTHTLTHTHKDCHRCPNVTHINTSMRLIWAFGGNTQLLMVDTRPAAVSAAADYKTKADCLHLIMAPQVFSIPQLLPNLSLSFNSYQQRRTVGQRVTPRTTAKVLS